MKHIQTLETRNLCESAKNGGCGECQTSCQSACKTSCGIANQAVREHGEEREVIQRFEKTPPFLAAFFACIRC